MEPIQYTRDQKPFYRYEDVPLLLAEEGQDPIMVFASSASISANQPIESRKFVDDYNISFAFQTEDIEFTGIQESGFILGPPGGPGEKISQSVEVIRSGQKIAYPNGQALYLAEDLLPGDYTVKVRSTGAMTLDLIEDVPYGEVEVVRNHSAFGAVRGRLNFSYYMGTGNLHTFSSLTGLLDPTIYPQINETKMTGCLGDYTFNDIYLSEVSFTAEPFRPITTEVTLDVYGKMEYVEGLADRITNNYGCIREHQKTVPHGLRTEILGADGIGIQYPLSFDYNIRSNRIPEIPVPITGYFDEDGELPSRVTKNEIDISIQIQGEKLDPFLKITGQRADVTIKLSDIGFNKSFSDNNYGQLKEFRLLGNLVLPEEVPEELKQYGVVDQDALTVSEGGFLRGRATVRQSYR